VSDEYDDGGWGAYDAARVRDIDDRYGGRVHCQHCVYWLIDWLDEKKLIEDDEEDGVRGQCRRHAPTPFAQVALRTAQMAGDTAWAAEESASIKHSEAEDYSAEGLDMCEVDEWPMTLPDAWCGDGVAGRIPPSAERLAELEALRDAWSAAMDARRAAHEAEKAERSGHA
jgi:hypothetical protein